MAEPARLVELLGALSLACDAADGFPPETTIRSAVIAVGLAREVGDDRLVADVLYGGLLRHIGCTAFAVEEAHRYGAGDDVSLRRVMATVDFGSPDDAVRRITGGLAPDAAPDDRARAIEHLLGDGPEAGRAHDAAQCDAGERLAAHLPVSDAARAVAAEGFERWDGNGGPAGLTGDEISLVTRIVEIGYVAELFRHREGQGAARDVLVARAGGQLDPDLVRAHLDLVIDQCRLVADPEVAPWQLLVDAEPDPVARLSDAQAADVALAFARFADLKSVWFTGHAERVARLAGRSAPIVGADEAGVRRLELAALLHDIGRVEVPTGTWDLPRRLSPPERDRVEGHASATQRILGATSLFADVAAVAGGTHERCDGSGYHRGASAVSLDPLTRLLAAADVAVALGEDRPHRPRHEGAAVEQILVDEVGDGRLDRAAVAAIIEVAGGSVGARPTVVAWPAGLSDREVEVLRLVAAGATNKDVARSLGITAKTVAHHVAHVYDKIGVRSRAGATLFALDCGLAGLDP